MSSFAETVADALANPAPPGQWRYLLIDAAALLGAVIQLPMGLEAPATDLLTRQVVADWRGSASPLLVSLPGGACGRAALTAWKSFAQPWRFANALTYIEAEMAPAEMLLALAWRTQVTLPLGLVAMLRYFDNRVFASLLRVLERDQRHALLAPGYRWVHADRSGRARTHDHESPAQTALGRFALTLTDAQEAALLESAAADAVVDQLLAQRHPEAIRMRPDQQHHAVADALDRAARHGITGNPDQVAYCGLALSHGIDFDERTPWQELLVEVRAGRVSLADGLHQLADGGAA